MTEHAMHEGDVPPQTVEGSVVFFAYAAIISAAVMSITLNVYHDVHHDAHSGSSSYLPAPIAVMVGVFVPLLCAFISHVAATIPTSAWVKAWLFALTGVLMYVSATAGTKTLAPVIGLAPALAVSIGVDATAMTFLGVLMLAMARKTALAEWRARTAERDRRSAVAAVAARQGRPAGWETAPGNALTTAPGNSRGNAPALQGGSTRALAAAAAVPGQVIEGGLAAGPGNGPAGEPGGLAGDAAPVPPARRPAVTDEEIRMLAEDLADELAADGKPLTVRAYTDRYGGKTSRVSPVVAEVKAAREARETQAASTAAGAR